jgi:hypothetical protein
VDCWVPDALAIQLLASEEIRCGMSLILTVF